MRSLYPSRLLVGCALLAGASLSAQTEDPALNNPANYYVYGDTTSFTAIDDPAAVEGDAFEATYGARLQPGNEFNAALEALESVRPVDAPGAVHTVSFRYRAVPGEPRSFILYLTSRPLGVFSGPEFQNAAGANAGYFALNATDDYQTFEATVYSPLEAGVTDEHRMNLSWWLAGANGSIIIDDIAVVTDGAGGGSGGGDGCDEDAVANAATSWNTYGDTEFAVVDDAAAVCEEAFRVAYTGTVNPANAFEAGFQILESASIDDAPGLTHDLSFRYRAEEATEVIFYAVSRADGTFSEDDVQFEEGSYYTLAATTEYQEFSTTVTSPRETAGDYYVYAIFPTSASDVPFYIDDVSLVTQSDGTCDEGPLNNPSLYTSFAGQASGNLVQDEAANCGDAMQILNLGPVKEDRQFDEGWQFGGELPDDVPGNEYRIAFRYRGDAPDNAALYLPSRKNDNTGDETAYFTELNLTTEYQTVVADFSSPRLPGDEGQSLYVAFGIAGLETPLYIDSFSIVQTNETCREGIYSVPDFLTLFNGANGTIQEVDDAAALCNDAIEVCNTGALGGNFDQGVQTVDELRLRDLPGKRFRFQARVRKAGGEPVSTGFYFSSRTEQNDEPEINSGFASVTIGTEYTDVDFEFDSALEPGQSNRFLHWSLGIGAIGECVYLDDVSFTDVTPAREENVTFYVRPDGSNGNTGLGNSPELALETITFALTELQPGDTLAIADGVYSEGNLALEDLDGTAEAPTVIRSINRWGAKIEGTEASGIIFRVASSEHVVLDGLEVYHVGRSTQTNTASGISTPNSSYVTVRNCYVHDCGCGGINGGGGDYYLFERNVARRNARFSPFNCSGINVFQPVQLDEEPGFHIVIRDNVSFGNECRLPFTPLGFTTPTDGNGIILDDFLQTQSFDAGGNPNDPYLAATLIENNLVFDNGGSGIKAFEVDNIVVRNNTSYHNNHVLEEFTPSTAEIAFQSMEGDVIVENNIAVKRFGDNSQAYSFDRKGNDYSFTTTRNIAVGGFREGAPNVQQDGNIIVSEDRQSFVAFAGARDTVETFTSVDDFKQYFGLREGSPAIDYGVAENAPATDLNGAERPQGAGYDLGAYEGIVAPIGDLDPDPFLTAIIERAADAIPVDGIREGFYTGPVQQVTKELGGNPAEPQDRSDISADWRGAYDATQLYVIVEVADQSLEAGDAVTVLVDGDNAKATAFDANDYAFTVAFDGAVTGDGLSASAAAATDRGYNVEVAVPWTLLGVEPADSLRIGIEVIVADVDGDEEAVELAWQSVVEGARTDPSQFGEGLLNEVPPLPPIAAIFDEVTVDGVGDETLWDDIARYQIENVLQTVTGGEGDLAGEWRAGWDSTNLYFLVDVVDDTIVFDNELGAWFQDDGVELYIDADNAKTFGGYDDNDYQIVVRPDGLVFDTKNNLDTSAPQPFASVVETADGYTVEVALPWAALQAEPMSGAFIGLDVHLMDDDNGDTRDSKLSWFAEIDQSFQNAALFGTAFLASREPSSVFESAPSLGEMLVYPNPTSGEVRLETVGSEFVDLQVFDLNGRVVFTQREVASGSQLDLGNLGTGVYVVRATGASTHYAQRLVVR